MNDYLVHIAMVVGIVVGPWMINRVDVSYFEKKYNFMLEYKKDNNAKCHNLFKHQSYGYRTLN